MEKYLLEKLSEINRRMAIHEGDANRRLASECVHILLLPKSHIPKQFIGEYESLLEHVKDTVSHLSSPGLVTAKIDGIGNTTAASFIKLLMDIEYVIRS